MKNIDIKSLIIGALLTSTIFLGVAATSKDDAGKWDDKQDAVDGAKDVLIRYWRSLHSEYDQQRWVELFDISAGDPEGWADEVWPSEDEEDEPPRKTLADVCRNAGSALTLQAEDDPSLGDKRSL